MRAELQTEMALADIERTGVSVGFDPDDGPSGCVDARAFAVLRSGEVIVASLPNRRVPMEAGPDGPGGGRASTGSAEDIARMEVDRDPISVHAGQHVEHLSRLTAHFQAEAPLLLWGRLIDTMRERGHDVSLESLTNAPFALVDRLPE